MEVERIAAIIDGARTIARLDWASGEIWKAFAASELSEEQTQALAERIVERKAEQRPAPRQVGQVARHSIFPLRKPQRSPDRKASLMRRRRMASSGPLPPQLAAHFTTGQLAVMRVISDEMRDRGQCAITIAEVAARAGVCRALVQQALHVAAGLGLLTVQERRRQGQKNLPNVVRVISTAWLAWIKRGPKSSPLAFRLASEGGGSISPGPTNTTYKKGSTMMEHDRSRPDGSGRLRPWDADSRDLSAAS